MEKADHLKEQDELSAEEKAEEGKKQSLIQQKNISLLKNLGRLEMFQTWRSLVVDETLAALKKDLGNPLGLSEAELRGKLMQYNSIDEMFYGIFKDIDNTEN